MVPVVAVFRAAVGTEEDSAAAEAAAGINPFF